ncbi:MAG TPA: hypothetical protein PKA58_30925 [Polyangium sp.]|nr:hypothetical protein [Polyangium sp.]
MAGYRGIGVVFARRAARAAGVEAKVAQRLSLAARDTFVEANRTGWVPIEHATEIFECVAPMVHSVAENPLRELGRAMARDNLAGPYKHFVRMMSVSFLMKQTALMWRAYHNAGKPSVEFVDPRTIVLRVFDYADLPERFRECMCGWIEQAVAMTGGKNVLATKSHECAVHTWRVTWA